MYLVSKSNEINGTLKTNHENISKSDILTFTFDALDDLKESYQGNWKRKSSNRFSRTRRRFQERNYLIFQ
jgi:hypothetical protein